MSIETLTCTTCGNPWNRERARGRKPPRCPACVTAGNPVPVRPLPVVAGVTADNIADILNRALSAHTGAGLLANLPPMPPPAPMPTRGISPPHVPFDPADLPEIPLANQHPANRTRYVVACGTPATGPGWADCAFPFNADAPAYTRSLDAARAYRAARQAAELPITEGGQAWHMMRVEIL